MCKMWIEDDRKPLNPGDKIIVQGMCFRITGECGRGNSRIVYYAKDDKGRKVLIKELYPVGMGIKRKGEIRLDVPEEHLQAMKNFKNDADIELRNEDSTNNATVFTFLGGEYEGVYYYVSAYDAGMTLENWLEEEKKEKTGYICSLLKICQKISQILQAYHEKNYIHLDVKPSNILVKKDDSVLFFDFDSVYKIQDIKDRGVSFSPGYTAPEVQYPERWCDIDPDRTDIYSVGAILYEGIFGKIPGREVRQARYVPDYSSVDGLKKLSPALWPKLTEIFKHTLTNSILSRFKNAGKLCLALGEAVKIAEKDLFILDMDLRSELSNAIKRDAELSDIHNALTEQGKKVAYICGTGGTGKTELALQYAEIYRPYYATIQKVTYRENFKTTISDIEISTGKADIDSICKILNNETLGNTLIIIDDFKISEGDKAVFQKLLENSCCKVRFILTSRDKPDNINNYFHEISTDYITNDLKSEIEENIVSIIAGEKSLKYKNEIKTFLNAIDYHFLTSSLFAELSRDILMTSPERYPIFLKTLKEQGISSPEIQNRKGEGFFEEIIKIFHEQKPFSEKEEIIMLNASLLPPFGMPEGEFLEYIKADITPTIGNSPVCDALVKRNWLRRETRNEYYISMHPIIREVCVSELIFETQGPFDFDLFKTLLDGLSSKLDLSAENVSEWPKVMDFGLLYATPICKKLSDLISRAKVRNPETYVSEDITRLMDDIEKRCSNNIFEMFKKKYGKALRFLSQNANFS